MEIKKTSPGYPCSNYIVNKISSTEELWLYAKTFVKTALDRGITPTETLLRLTTTLSMLSIDKGISCPNFSEYGANDEERCNYLLTNPLVGTVKSCETLYKKTDSQTGACRLCSYSKWYRNKNEEQEYAVLKYMLQSEDNLNFVADYINEDFFSCCMDVSMGIPVIKAYVLPMCKILVQSLLKNNIRLMIFSPIKDAFFNSNEPYEMIWEDAYRTFPRNRKIPVGLSNNPMWQNALKVTVKEKIMGSRDLTKTELIDIFNEYIMNGLSEGTKSNMSLKKPADKKDAEQLLLEDIILKVKPAKEPELFNQPDKKKNISGKLVKESVTSKTAATNTSNESTTVADPPTEDIADTIEDTSAPDEDIDEAVASLLNQVSTEPPSADIPFTGVDVPMEIDTPADNDDISMYDNNTSPVLEEPPFLPVRTSLPGKSQEPELQLLPETKQEKRNAVTVLERPLEERTFIPQEHSKESTKEKISSLLSPSPSADNERLAADAETAIEVIPVTEEEKQLLNEKNLILQPVLKDKLRKGIILHVGKNKPLPAPFYQGVLRDKQLAIEVIRTEKGNFIYLMWSRHMKKYISVSMEEAGEDMKKLLSYKSIQKICHTPYVLYGASKLYHIPVKNVFSLQTVCGRLFPTAEPLAYRDLCNNFKTKHNFGEYASEELIQNCPFLGGMPLYRDIHKVMTNMVNAHSYYSLFTKDALLDEALGCSYFFGLNFKDKGQLLLLVGNNEFYFNKDFYHEKVTEGRCHSYFVKESIDVVALYQYILQRLAEKGIFRTTNLQVLGMDSNQLLLFIEKDNEGYISSLIDLLTFEYGRTYVSVPFILHNLIHTS